MTSKENIIRVVTRNTIDEQHFFIINDKEKLKLVYKNKAIQKLTDVMSKEEINKIILNEWEKYE